MGLKENVIIGKLIPAGTGMKRYKNIDLDYGVNAEIMENYTRQQEELEAQMMAEEMEVYGEDDEMMEEIPVIEADETEEEAEIVEFEKNDVPEIVELDD